MHIKRKISLFYIEDSELYSIIINEKLREVADFRIQLYTTAEAAFKDLYLKPDLILLDYALPGINGLDAILKFKKNSPEIPIIVLSGQENLDVALEVMSAGASGYISKKKFSAQELYEVICSICGGKERKTKLFGLTLRKNKNVLIAFLILLFLGIMWYNY